MHQWPKNKGKSQTNWFEYSLFFIVPDYLMYSFTYLDLHYGEDNQQPGHMTCHGGQACRAFPWLRQTWSSQTGTAMYRATLILKVSSSRYKPRFECVTALSYAPECGCIDASICVRWIRFACLKSAQNWNICLHLVSRSLLPRYLTDRGSGFREHVL